MPDPGEESLAAALRVVAALVARGETVATCESLTGGLVGALLTSVPGASAVYRGGLIGYATDLKHRLAAVDDAVLSRHGAVAAATAEAMARGAAKVCGADWGLATTGVAGPDPQEGHPPGTVFVAVAGPGRRPPARRLDLIGDRAAIRRDTVAALIGWFATLVG